MAKKSSEKTKLYVVIFLSIVAAVMAYFRFVRKPAQTPRLALAASVANAMYEIPELPAWLSGASQYQPASRPPYTPPSRDIFVPVDDTPAEHPDTGRPGERPDARPLLSAIMTGSQGRLAVINSQVVRVGEKVGEHTVVEIGRSRVVLQKGRAQLILTVGDP